MCKQCFNMQGTECVSSLRRTVLIKDDVDSCDQDSSSIEYTEDYTVLKLLNRKDHLFNSYRIPVCNEVTNTHAANPIKRIKAKDGVKVKHAALCAGTPTQSLPTTRKLLQSAKHAAVHPHNTTQRAKQLIKQHVQQGCQGTSLHHIQHKSPIPSSKHCWNLENTGSDHDNQAVAVSTPSEGRPCSPQSFQLHDRSFESCITDPSLVATRTREASLLATIQRQQHELALCRQAEAAAKKKLAEMSMTLKGAGKMKSTLQAQLQGAQHAASTADADVSVYKRRVDALQRFLRQERAAKEEAIAKLHATEQRVQVLSTQVELDRQQLVMLQESMSSSATSLAQAAWVETKDKLQAAEQQLKVANMQNNILQQQVAGLQAALQQLYVTRIGKEQLGLLQQLLTAQQCQQQHNRNYDNNNIIHAHAQVQQQQHLNDGEETRYASTQREMPQRYHASHDSTLKQQQMTATSSVSYASDSDVASQNHCDNLPTIAAFASGQNCTSIAGYGTSAAPYNTDRVATQVPACELSLQTSPRAVAQIPSSNQMQALPQPLLALDVPHTSQTRQPTFMVQIPTQLGKPHQQAPVGGVISATANDVQMQEQIQHSHTLQPPPESSTTVSQLAGKDDVRGADESHLPQAEAVNAQGTADQHIQLLTMQWHQQQQPSPLPLPLPPEDVHKESALIENVQGSAHTCIGASTAEQPELIYMTAVNHVIPSPNEGDKCVADTEAEGTVVEEQPPAQHSQAMLQPSSVQTFSMQGHGLGVHPTHEYEQQDSTSSPHQHSTHTTMLSSQAPEHSSTGNCKQSLCCLPTQQATSHVGQHSDAGIQQAANTGVDHNSIQEQDIKEDDSSVCGLLPEVCSAASRAAVADGTTSDTSSVISLEHPRHSRNSTKSRYDGQSSDSCSLNDVHTWSSRRSLNTPRVGTPAAVSKQGSSCTRHQSASPRRTGGPHESSGLRRKASPGAGAWAKILDATASPNANSSDDTDFQQHEGHSMQQLRNHRSRSSSAVRRRPSILHRLQDNEAEDDDSSAAADTHGLLARNRPHAKGGAVAVPAGNKLSPARRKSSVFTKLQSPSQDLSADEGKQTVSQAGNHGKASSVWRSMSTDDSEQEGRPSSKQNTHSDQLTERPKSADKRQPKPINGLFLNRSSCSHSSAEEQSSDQDNVAGNVTKGRHKRVLQKHAWLAALGNAGRH